MQGNKNLQNFSNKLIYKIDFDICTVHVFLIHLLIVQIFTNYKTGNI